ncbi:peptidogalycan biosysnthesis protein [Chryseobacterium gambrini]|uniref:peptidogalycan biosysnthesis protein n=1 Tax=Chryseobacterium gambrini TaxID=373672 RepID=UPI0022F1D1AB|nr:peptidogalycan biosysnthesis protein [Chryseobacterium gambrini]WBV54463.1 peptidogalycan biosysnthesis protein [Chryseobacterium gambrini]
MSYTLRIFQSVADLPEDWNVVIGNHNILLSGEYFRALENSRPQNMECFFVGFFKENELIGGALFQYLSFLQHKTFQNNAIFCSIRNFVAKKFSRDVMILGNNMLTGQNGFYFDVSKITSEEVIPLLEEAVYKMQKEIRKTSLIIYKDYQSNFVKYFEGEKHRKYFRFSVQPNMILRIRENWNNFDDYINDFSKKYRARAKTAKKKLEGIIKKELQLDMIRKYQSEMNVLYQNVAENAPFNTFFLRENHFESMKENLGDNFRLFGYFSNEKLIGFYTMILNNKDIDTYFLGYEKDCQKQKQIYLNMLFDMVEFGIHHRFERIIFGRTALEIKSTIGAEPTEIFGLIKHNNFMINPFLKTIFPSISPKTEWIQRKPFK